METYVELNKYKFTDTETCDGDDDGVVMDVLENEILSTWEQGMERIEILKEEYEDEEGNYVLELILWEDGRKIREQEFEVI